MIEITEIDQVMDHYDRHLIIPHLTNGLAYNPFMKLDDLIKRHQAQDVHIAVIYDDPRFGEGESIVGAVAWEILEAPSDANRRYMNILALGCLTGTYEESRNDILIALETIAQVSLCQTMLATGRRGWERMARAAGYVVMDHVLFYKEFK